MKLFFLLLFASFLFAKQPQVEQIFVPCAICNGQGYTWKKLGKAPPFRAPCTVCGGIVKYCNKETGWKYLTGKLITIRQ